MSGESFGGYLEKAPAAIYVSSDPNGVVSAQRGTIAVSTTTRATYQNTDGGTTWVQGIYSQASNTLFGGNVPSLPMVAGKYYRVPNTTALSTSSTLGNNTLRAVPVPIPNAITVTRMGLEVTSAGDAGSVIRLGIYGDDGTGHPGSLVIDAGTIPGDAVAVAEISGLSTAIGPGVYWFGAAVQNAPTTQPTVRIISAGTLMSGIASSVIFVANQPIIGFSQNSVSGALPSTFTGLSSISAMASLFIKT